MLKLGTIAEEAALCRAAWVGSSVGDLTLHCHHEELIEWLIEPAWNRIGYILTTKDVQEQALRLRLFRPLSIQLMSADLQKAVAAWRNACADSQKAYVQRRKAYTEADWRKLDARWEKSNDDLKKAHADCLQSANKDHSLICQPGCPWNGHTIFPYLK